MRAKQFIRKINEAADESSVITTEVIKLISDGHTEVSPDVITAKVSAALGRPFMLKDLVSANNSSPELQHYIDSINPSKIKFSTDILTVKNQDPMKEKQAAQDGVAKMAARAGSRPRLGESTEGVKYGVYKRGGSIGERKGLIKTFDTKEEAQEYAKRQRKHLSPGERKYYKLGYTVKAVKPGEQIDEGWNTGSDRVHLPDEPSTYWSGNGELQKEYEELYDKLVPAMGAADTIEGEVLRAASKIVYRHYNDGDEFNAASFSQLVPYIGKVTSYDDLAHKATEFALKANGEYHPNAGWDSLDVMDYGPEDYDDDYEEDDSWDDDDEDEPHPGWDDEDEDLDEARADQVYTVNIVRRSSFGGDRRVRPTSGTLPELIKYFGYTLETGKSYEHERGRKKINMNPKTIESLVDNLNKAKSNAAANGHSSTYYEVAEVVDEDWKKNLGTAALGAALAFGGAKAANAGQGPEQAPQKAAAAATQQAQAQNPYHNDLGVLVGVAQSKGGMQVLGKILSADQIQQVKAAYAKAKADPNLAKSAQFKQGRQLGFELGNSYADSSSQQMTDLNKRGPSYAGILSPMVVKPGEARSAEDITKVNQANAGKLKQAVTAAYGNMMAGGLQEGWESGPEERAPRERDPDAEYDARRQEKMDIEAEKAQAQRPQTKVYTLTGRGPNYEPNYKFPGEYDSQEAAIAARAKLMADPSTPNPRDIGISTHTRYLDESRETPLRDKEDYQAKKKALQDIQVDPSTSQDPELSAEVLRRLAGLKQQAKAMGLEESRKK